MSSSNKDLGKEGEDAAAKYLQEQGYSIIGRNIIYGRLGEVDIIAKKDDTYVFVEVRTRRDIDYVDPADTITRPKQRKIIRVAEAYIDTHNLENFYSRLDVITVSFKEGAPVITHIENAFEK